jgi:OOP family OmpA-OmpF porin
MFNTLHGAHQEKTMHPCRFKPHVGILALALLTHAQLQAQDISPPTGLYVGLGKGESEASIDQVRIRQNLLASGLNTLSLTEDERGQAHKAFVGFPIHPNWAVEAGYFDLGRFGFNTTTAPAGGLSGTARIQGLNLDLVGTLSITDRWSVIGRVGAAYAQTKDHFAGNGAVSVTNPMPSQRETNVKYGLGTQYAFTPALSVRLEAERYRVNDAIGRKGDVDMISLGLIYRFGGPAAPAKASEKH